MAEREDVKRRVAVLGQGLDRLPLLEADRSTRVIGELVHVGRVDELDDRILAVIETGAGDLRYARFELQQDLAILSGAQPGALVAFAPNQAGIRPSDEAIARVAARSGGIYSPEVHAELEPYLDTRIVAANVRRLEAMRRAGLVERKAGGTFNIRLDHLDSALKFEELLVRRAPFSAQAASYWSLSEQIDALGPTELDRVLAGLSRAPTGEGPLVRAFEAALQQRRMFLIEQGLLERDQQHPPRSALAKLGRGELSAQAQALSRELGVPVLMHGPHRVEGVYARRIDLAQGRVAIILGERQAYLVSWRPPLERFSGREVVGVTRGHGLSWSLRRGLGIQLPPM